MMNSRPSDLFQPGDLLNNTYRIEMLLGRGGTSDVYKARSEISGNLVAIKVLKQELSGNEDFTVLMAREENIREIRHDAVVRYSENHRTPDGHIYLLMDYIDGPGLDQKLKQGPMSAEDLLIICRRVSEGLKAAHTRNIVHRDLSPDNIILRDGDPAQAVIIDFGIAKDTNPGAETIVGNEFAGKYSYAAPEQMAGQTDARADVYALGALLLANFRGAAPSLGDNPMQVVENKQKPLDTSGLPQPFKRVIERMCDPDPNTRLASAADVLSFLDDPDPDPGPDTTPDDLPPTTPWVSEDATIIVPKATTPKSAAKAPTDKPATETDSPPRRKSPVLAGLAALALALTVIAGFAIGAFDTLLGPNYPVAAPFTLIVENPKDGPVRAIGNMPSEDSRDQLADLVEQADLTLASGAISDSWGQDVLATIAPLSALTEWRLAVSNNQARVSGLTDDAELAAKINALFKDGLPGNLDGIAEITYRLPVLPISEVRGLVGGFEECGPLKVKPGSVGGGFGPDDPIEVSGLLAGTETRVRLYDALNTLGGARDIALKTETLNPALCVVERVLPKAPTSNIAVEFRLGGKDTPNPSGRFFVGENPVIDVLLPAEVQTGFLTVSVLDVSGNVFHLLPNISRQDNAVADLRVGRTGPVPVRVAYDLAESAQHGGLAFRVDDSTLGKSRILVLHSSEPLFAGLRPTSESAAGFAEALKESSAKDSGLILSLDSKILLTAEP
jgi:eukaryotic-like serine/threonine-protein kinase